MAFSIQDMVAARLGLVKKAEVQQLIDDALKAQAAEYPRWLLETADAYRLRMPDPQVYGNQADLYRKLSWVLSACEISAQFAATTKFSVSRIIQDKEPRDIPNHPFEMLLKKPNPLDGRYAFLTASFISYKLTGNCYWWMNKPSEDAPPDELWFIPSHMIIPIPDENLYIRGYYYYPENGREMILLPDEILHIRRFNPANRFVGLSAIESLAQVAMGDLEMQAWNTNLFGEGNGQLRGVLAFQEMVNDNTWGDIKKQIREASRKREHMLLRGVGVGGVNWIQNSVSQKEMEFLEGRKFNKEEIWTVLAPGLYSMLSENATEANSRTGQSAFKDLTIYPIHTMLNEEITNKILPFYGSEAARPLVGMFEDVRGEDRELKLKEIEQYAVTHTLSEIREEWYGDDPLGDERDELLPAQINAQSGGIQEPPAPPPGAQPTGMMPEEKKPETEGEPPQTDESKPTRAQKAVLELNTWQRKAVKRVGERVKFETVDIPETIAAYVNQFLPGCDSMSAVKSVFDNARRMVDPDNKPKEEAPREDSIILLAQSLNELAAKMTQPAPLTLEAIKALLDNRRENITVYSPVNVPAHEQNLHFSIPEQPAPVSNVYLSPTVETAKAPDVRVDSPVHIHNAVEQPAAPIVNIENNHTLPEQPAPIINIENKLPELPAPEVAVKNEFVLPEQPAPVVNVTNQVNPTPVEVKNDVTVQPAEVKVDMPKPKREKQKIKRDQNTGLIESTDTEIEYE